MKNWQALDLCNIPAVSGVYGFKLYDQWLYIGKSKNLSQRLNKRHVPLQTALELFLDVKIYYRVSADYHRLERHLIKKLVPTWNDATSRSGNKYPCCDLPFEQKITPDQRKKAVSVIGF